MLLPTALRAPFGAIALIAGLTTALAVACDTGFGQPCDIPQTDEFRSACSPAPTPDGEDDGGKTVSKSSCAIKNFAGCATRVCLVYRDSKPFCSEPCVQNSDCEGGALCRPIVGDTAASVELCRGTECYCVRQGDLND